MGINTLAVATLMQTELDKVAVQESVTGWMDANAGKVIYNGGNEIKIPKMTLDGLGDYDRDAGYAQGGVTLSYETKQMTQDRGRKFQLDAMDVNETNFVATAAAVMAEFQREKVIPEVDAYRLSKIATAAITAKKAGMVSYGYVPGATGTSALRKVKEAITAVRSNGYTGPLVIHATPAFCMELDLELAGRLSAITFSKGGVETKVPAIDNIPIIETDPTRMVTAITLLSGKDTQKAGGFTKGSTALDINFIVVPRIAPIAVNKQDKMKIFTPEQNQDADAWKMHYRRYHDLWIPDNKLDSIAMSIKDNEPA